MVSIFEKVPKFQKKDNFRDITLKNCPGCNNILRPNDKFCSQCSLVMNRKALDEIQGIKNKLPEMMELVMKSEMARELLAEMERERTNLGIR